MGLEYSSISFSSADLDQVQRNENRTSSSPRTTSPGNMPPSILVGAWANPQRWPSLQHCHSKRSVTIGSTLVASLAGR